LCDDTLTTLIEKSFLISRAPYYDKSPAIDVRNDERIIEAQSVQLGGIDMATYILFGKYSTDVIGKISAARTKGAKAVIGDNGGEIKAAYALLGDTDLVLVVEFPNMEKAMKASVALSKQLGIGFTTAPALTIEEFDKLITGK
jgi:uncharacterized protein with GYD domain